MIDLLKDAVGFLLTIWLGMLLAAAAFAPLILIWWLCSKS